MTQKINRLHISTRTVAMVLSIVMLIGSIATGSMLNTFAAYLNDAAKADAVAQAATEGGAIALNAIPSEDNAEDADAKPDLSGFAENDLVRGIKADAVGTSADAAPLSREKKDLAGTGANADLASTGQNFNTNESYLYIKIDNKWNSYYINSSGFVDFEIPTTQNVEWKFVVNTNSFGHYSSDTQPDGSSSTNWYEARSSSWGGNSNFSKNLTAGQYVVQYKETRDNWNTFWYIFYRKQAHIKGDSAIGANWDNYDTNMTYHGDKCYKYEFTANSNGDKYFRLNMVDGGSTTYFYPTNNGDTVGSDYGTGYNCGNSSDNNDNAFKLTTLSGGKYTIWLKIDGNTKRVWVTKDESGATKEYYLTGYINGQDYKTLASASNFKFSGTSAPYTFTLNSTTATQWITIADSAGYAYHPKTHGSGSGINYETKDTGIGEDYKWKVENCKGKDITFTWDGTKLSWVVSSGGNIDVYAKDGAAPINWDKKTQGGATSTSGITKDGKKKYYYNYGIIGTTTAACSGVTFTRTDCSINNDASGSTYQLGSVPVGKQITVTTTIDSTYSSKYYVAGWCVNGITYKNGTDTVGVNPSTTTSYSFNYTLPSDTEGMLKDVAGHPVVEITPIYYLRNNDNTVTFYIEGYTDVQSKWGNTPYVYPFYGNLDGYQNTFGTYPGQPVVNVGGQMSMEIPIYTNPISATVTSTVIKGVTISNGYADHVHRNCIYGWTTGSNVNDDKDHMQTYDFDDFYKIWAEHTDTNGHHPNQIFFRFKEETKTYNRYTYGGGNSGQFANSTTNLTEAKINAINSNNGWELLKDRHDRPVNLFGDYNAVKTTSQGTTTGFNSNALYVISTGYNANIAGDYGTMWKIYDGNNGALITRDATNARYGIPPSLLHVQGNATGGMTSTVSYPSASHSVPGVDNYTDSNEKYNTIYKALKAAGYNNRVVYITYEKDTQDTRNLATGEGAYRADGQWFYTFATDEVQSTIGIEYYNRATGSWTADTVSDAGVGTTTKATAAFDSDSYVTSDTAATSNKYLTSEDGTWNFTATESGTDNKYAFSGWYLKYDDTYEAVTGSTTSGSIKASANYRLIARYVPVTTSSLVITHKLDPESTGSGEATMTVTYNNVTQTVNYLNGVATAEINVSWGAQPRNIDVTLTATPQNDGKVKSISVDDQISSYATNTTDYTLPCTTDGRAVTRTLSFTDHNVYNSAGTSLVIDQLDYVSNIEATPHYYEFTYTFDDRGGTQKNYTARGEISEAHYADYVDSNHEISDDFVKSRAPFESNFLKTLKLGTITGKTYSSDTHTFNASATYNATPYTPIYDVKIKLPYDYYTTSGTASGTPYKKYTANSSTYNESKPAFTLKANYDTFVTNDATSTKAGTSTKVSKVTDSTDVNHTGNDFITAADKLGTKYFRYWEIKRLADTYAEQATAPVIARIYYPDLHYRFYADSYVEAVYTDNDAEYWSNVNKDGTNSELSASVLYLESSRNQYNTVANGTNDKAADAADIIYNDFIFNYRFGDKEFISSTDAEIGMVLERVKSSDGTKWVTGDSSVTNMDSYKAANEGTEDKTAIQNWLKDGGTAPKGCIKQKWNNDELNNKNFTEQNYPAYAQYGQTVSDHSITFKNDGTMDNYVYRAWAYIKDSKGNVAVSDPAYFSMNYIAAQNYKAG